MAKNITKNFCESSIPPLVKDDGTIASDSKSKAEIFAQMFSSNLILDDNNKIPENYPISEHTMPKIKFTSRNVRKTLQNLKEGKANGPDNIPAIVLKTCAQELAPVLTKLFKLSLKSTSFPSSWKHARVCPVPKKGSSSNPANYRPIALTSLLSKTMESIINQQILKHLESNCLISDHQYGFRKARSTGDLLSYVTHMWHSALESFGETRVVALDISKAFDKVWHKGLLAKLPMYGINSELISWIENFLLDRSIEVCIDGVSSDSFSINSGVPQGSIVSPTLFLLFINDLLQSTKNPLHSYADDSTLHNSSQYTSQTQSSSHLSNTRNSVCNSINENLKTITTWGEGNIVRFNQTKTQSLLITRKVDKNPPSLQMLNSPIAKSTIISMLGLKIPGDLSWKQHIKDIAKQSSQPLGVLFRTRRFFTSAQLLILYKSEVRPIVEYYSHIWGGSPPSVLKLIDGIQKKAIKLINKTSLTKDLQTLSHRRSVSSLCLFYKYYNNRSSLELQGCIPPPMVFRRNTRLSSNSHAFCVEIPKSKTELFASSFFPRTASLWNKLPQQAFPSNYNLQLFKCRINSLDLDKLSSSA